MSLSDAENDDVGPAPVPLPGRRRFEDEDVEEDDIKVRICTSHAGRLGGRRRAGTKASACTGAQEAAVCKAKDCREGEGSTASEGIGMFAHLMPGQRL